MKTKQCLITIALLGVLACTASAQSWLTNGLVAYYPFNGNADDASGNGNHGIVTGAVLAPDRFRHTGQAFEFSGRKPQRIEVTINNDVQTWSAWVQSDFFGYSVEGLPVDSAPAGSDRYVFGIGMNSYRKFGLRLNRNAPMAADTAYLFAEVDNQSSSSPFLTNPPASLLMTLGSNTWRHVVVVTISNLVMLYLDGVLAHQSILSSERTPLSPGSVLSIGDFSDPISGRVWLGRLDDIRLYARAFSSDEVAQLYAMELGPRTGIMKAVKPFFSNMMPGWNYQLQLSADMNSWTNQGSPFTATNRNMIYPQYWDVDNWGALFFRLEVAP